VWRSSPAENGTGLLGFGSSLAANGRILLRTQAELGHEAGAIEVLVNFCDLSALNLENPGHLHAEGFACRRDRLSAGTEERSQVRARARSLQAHPVALAEAPVFLCAKVRKRTIELLIILVKGGAALDWFWRGRVQVDHGLCVESHESIPIMGVQRVDS